MEASAPCRCTERKGLYLSSGVEGLGAKSLLLLLPHAQLDLSSSGSYAGQILAVLQVEAVDIFAMLRSFLSKRQSITRVTVYPSDYGLQKMAEEEKLGPVGLFGQSRRVAAEAAEKPTKDAPQKGGKFEMSAAEQAAILETLNEQDSGEEDEGEQTRWFLCLCSNLLIFLAVLLFL